MIKIILLFSITGAGAMTAAKNAVFIGLQLENCCLVQGIDFWWWWGGVVGDEQIFG